MLLWKAATRVVGMLLMLALALLALGIALYCLDGMIRLGAVRPDRLLHLPSVRRHVGHFLGQIAASGPTAALALVCGLGAMLLGLLLIRGLLRSPKQRLAVLSNQDGNGMLGVRTGALRDMTRALAEQAPGATSIQRPRLRLNRRADRGRLDVTATRTQTTDAHAVQRAVTDSLQPISQPFNLKPRVRVRLGQAGERVE